MRKFALIDIHTGGNERPRHRAKRAAIRAEQACMISKALHGNVEIVVEAIINVGP